MKPKPPPPPELPPAVPPAFRVIATESPPLLETHVNEALGAGQSIEANTAALYSVNGMVIISQACTRNPAWEKRVRTRLSTQKVLNNGGIY